MKNSGMYSQMMKDEKIEKDEGQMTNNKRKEQNTTSMAYVDNITVITKLNNNNTI